MSENHIFSLQTLRARAAFDGGFAEQPETAYRPDVTAWAIMALDGDSGSAGLIQAARDRLVASQSSDGRIAVSPDHSNAFWPTAPAVLAWCGSPAHAKAMARAASFLAQTGGRTWAKAPDAPFAHDPTIPGWSWVENTFSWVEPTALALLALEAAGYGQHSRMADGVRLLMDRQLPEGGWNYGNTLVYDQQLRPQPDNTGIALTALALKVEQAGLSWPKAPAIIGTHTWCWKNPVCQTYSMKTAFPSRTSTAPTGSLRPTEAAAPACRRSPSRPFCKRWTGLFPCPNSKPTTGPASPFP